MAGEVLAGLAAFKGVTDAISALSQIKNEVERKAAIFEVTDKLVKLQQEHLSLIAEHAELREAHAKLKNWEKEKARYELFAPAEGVLAYRLKEAERGADPDHSICATCYENGKKSILQEERHDVGRMELLVCHPCGTSLLIRGAYGPNTTRRTR